MNTSSSHIFISYRRDDSQGTTGRIHDRLINHFDHVYMDVDSIGLGVDFFEKIDEALRKSGIFLAVVGRFWLDASDEYGRRIDNPDDLVRHEISTALHSGLRVIPLLVDGARLPRSTDLPEDLAPLVRRNAFEIRHESFHADTERLIKAIEEIIEEDAAARAAALAEKRAERSAERRPASSSAQQDQGRHTESVRSREDVAASMRLAADKLRTTEASSTRETPGAAVRLRDDAKRRIPRKQGKEEQTPAWVKRFWAGAALGSLIGIGAMLTYPDETWLYGLLTGIGGALLGGLSASDRRTLVFGLVATLAAWIGVALWWGGGGPVAAGAVFGAPVGAILAGFVGWFVRHRKRSRT